uniref:Pleckstrin homology domain containing, family G (with RhoGef domain) member 4 n=1 Tax=Lates calcarifer TaxID=8187 RepID=A0A4W6CWE6_LATCA
MDSESLDRCIQTALSALYPPFQATSSTVLCQVLNVVESCYRGDGLRYLLHFLLPAKQFLQNLQQHACLQYCGLLFRHEGWPLCIHEKVVVQLCPLDQRLLRPGDFYLLVSPGAAPPPPRAHSQEVSEIALRSLFSMAWLDSVNREREQRGASRLERCVLSTNGDVFRVPWEDLVYPQFISRPRTALKDNKESSVKDGDMLINMSHDLSRDTNSSRQEEVKLLPSSTKTDQSPASSEAEDSEGEYVELTELPLPRFSPQKGSLTQSISLQHRARTGTNTAPTAQTLSAATAHTPHSTHTHSAASAHTPHSTHTHYAASAHTPHSTHTHSAASAHTPHSTHIHSAATTHTPKTTNTHSTRSCVEVSSHTELCSKLIEENLNQDCRPVILTPISPTTSSFAPPEVMGTVCIQSEQQMSQEQTEGTDVGRSVKLNSEPENCIEQRLEEEVDRGKEGEMEEKTGEGEVMEKQERMKEMVALLDEGVEKEEEEEVEETECRGDEDLLPQTHTTEEGGDMEEEDESEETEGDGEEEMDEEGDDEFEEDGAEEVEVEEEVQVIIVQQSQERWEEEQVMKDDEREGGEEKDGEGEGGETHTDKEATHTHSEDSYSENTTLQTHSEDSYSENNTLHTQCEDSYSENNTLQTHSEDSYSENTTIQTHPEDSDSENTTLQTHSEDSYSENNTLQTHSEDSYSENNTLQAHSEGSYSENDTQHIHLKDSHSEKNSHISSVTLAGTRDRSGRALLTVCTWSSVWSNPDCDRPELLRLLLYYTSTLSRKEVRELGLTVLVDARRAAPVPALFSALRSLQENTPGSIHTVLLLINKDSSLRLDKPAAPQRVEQLTNQCEDVINLLQKTVNILQSTPLPAAAEDAELLLSRYKAVMRSILEDGRLVRLQQEGGASLSRLRREESSISTTEEYRAEVETVSSLYDQVDELLHRLVTLSNSRTQELNFIVDFRNLEQGFTEVRSWLEEVGEVHLKTLDEPEDSLELLNKKQQDFKDFYPTAYDYCKRGEELLGRLERWDDVSSTDLHNYEVKVHSFWAQLQDFSQRVNTTGQNIDRAVRLYRFLDQAYGWALDGMRHLAGISMEECTLPDKCQAVIGCLEDYQRQHPPIPDAHFQEMKAAAGELRGERGLRQWSFAWSKCQETKKMFDRKMELALKTRDSAHRRRSDSALSRTSVSSRKTLSGLWGLRESSSSSSSSSCPPEEDTNTSSPPRHSSSLLPLTFSPITSTCSHHTPQRTPLLQRLFRSASTDESSDHVDISSSTCSSFSTTSSSSSRRQQLRKTQSFDCPSTPEVSRYGPCPRAHSEPVRRGNTGVFIRGLEVSSTEAADHTLCPRTAAHGWFGSSGSWEMLCLCSKLRHIVDEMVTTEREYVRSLQYIIHHYFPEMDRADLPQDLRGKRSVVFGNLEKLLDFHSQFFLRELEACWKHPLRVPHCFLRHQEQFGLYALYSKNKPKSDALLLNHGNAFFRRKQVELGDKMDLSSYLLKPIQRMSKYALLLTDLMKEVGVAQEAELVTLQAATNMVKFQLRHGNDLLAMDAIRDCDVNLKEQGQLIRQDEFTVWTGRRKCQRHIFLFEELVLFSKPKKMEGGLDVFIYKHSFKTADVGLTESTGDSGLRFEIWFRRRTSKNQTFILQAATSYVKHAWTSDIARILWTQATRNKEMRLKEMVSMGVGNKPFLDIQPSDAAISDRAVHCIMKSRGARTRASIAVSVFDHSNPFKRGAVTSDPSTSGPSSSSLLGPQTLSPSPAAESSFITSCIEEDEQEHETSSQPSMTDFLFSLSATESSGSSSRCLSGSTGSDSGCVSSHLQETLPEEPSPPSQPSSSTSNKQHLSSQYISAKSAPVIGPATIV